MFISTLSEQNTAWYILKNYFMLNIQKELCPLSWNLF